MVKILLVGFGLVVICNMTYANVTVMDNSDLSTADVPMQPEPLQPVLPEYNGNGQVGSVAVVPYVPSASLGLSTSSASPVAIASGTKGGVSFQLPVSPLIDLSNQPSRNIYIPQNWGR
jgi:hypothetical protein